ncbi:MAG TPA: putative glycoside hydrolase [Clostridiaceae bacterium]|nr:putative glycoside hydrolase [Clostridiaceae bacterium]
MLKKTLRKTMIIIMAAIIFASCSANTKNGNNNPEPTTSGSSLPSQTPEQTSETTPAPATTPDPTPTPTPTPEPTPEPMEPVKVKAVYLTGTTVAKSIDHYIDLVNKTELNSLVIDIKESGYINYVSDIPLAKELSLSRNVYNVQEVLKKCHDNNIYVIGRIVVFRDNGLSTKKPEYAIKKPNGSLWKEGKLGSWTNPYIQEVLDYNIEIAKEAAELGFDEIQFDYVRFPTTSAKEVTYGENVPPKSEAINGFLKKATEEIKKVRDIPVSADIFGIVIESDRDGKAIGQMFDEIGLHIDYISPMIYPSHYANASKGVFGNGVGQKINGILFTAPDLEPYKVIYNALLKTKDRISQVPGYKAKVRPYLQDFTIKMDEGYYQVYGSKQVREQIQAVYDAGYEEWILWDGSNKYSEDALLPEGQN